MKIKILSFLMIGLLSACLETNTESLRIPEGVDLKQKEFFNPFGIAHFFSANNAFNHNFNEETFALINAKKMTLISYGGKNPDDIREKYTFTFDKKGNLDTYEFVKAPDLKSPYTKATFKYNSSKLAKMDFIHHVGKPSSDFIEVMHSNAKESLLIHHKNSESQIELYSEDDKLNMYVDRMDNKIFALIYYVPTGESLRTFIEKQNEKIEFSDSEIEKCLKYVVYTDNGLPQVAYILGQNYTQDYRAQQYSYDENNKLTMFQQWIGNDLVSSIKIDYGKDYLPESLTFNDIEYKIEFD